MVEIYPGFEERWERDLEDMIRRDGPRHGKAFKGLLERYFG